MTLLVTGAAGFIGSSFVRQALQSGYSVVCLDLLTYAGNLLNLNDLKKNPSFRFVHGDICDSDLVDSLFVEHKPVGVVHFAAESHVDNSILGPKAFLKTNVEGTFTLLEATRKHIKSLPQNFKFIHVSTDEVFGELDETGKFNESTAYAPSSPYSATKACSDHLVRAWHKTYGIPTIVTNCSNNYGPRQHPEKLIPRMICNALQGEKLPIYGSGHNIRDWIYVEDHCAGVLLALKHGTPGDTYCFGGNSERRNIDVVKAICSALDSLRPLTNQSYAEKITFVEDRPGHDFRYAIDDNHAQKKLGFKRNYASFEDGLKTTIQWYLDNAAWVSDIGSAKENLK